MINDEDIDALQNRVEKSGEDRLYGIENADQQELFFSISATLRDQALPNFYTQFYYF
jgi:hypothetical protein